MKRKRPLVFRKATFLITGSPYWTNFATFKRGTKKKGFTAEQVMGKLGEAEVLLDQGDEIVRRMKKEVRSNPKVIATGGLATLIVAESETIEEVNKFLTLKGLKIIYERNEKRKRRQRPA
jgi:hypothetical protein